MMPKLNVIIWDDNNDKAWTFKRRPVPTDPHFLCVRISGEIVDYSFCGLDLDEIKRLPRDAVEITIDEANRLPRSVLDVIS